MEDETKRISFPKDLRTEVSTNGPKAVISNRRNMARTVEAENPQFAAKLKEEANLIEEEYKGKI